STIWPMFGVANQLLACAALAVATTIILREGKRRAYAFVTLAPLAFVATTTLTAGVESITTLFLPMARSPATHTTGVVNVIVTAMLLVCIVTILVGSAVRWLALVRAPRGPLGGSGATSPWRAEPAAAGSERGA